MSYETHDDDLSEDDGHSAGAPQGVATGDLVDAGQRGRLAGLEELRDMLARQLETTVSGRDFAALSSRFSDVLAQIEQLEELGSTAGTGAPVTDVDEFTARRDRRKDTA